MLGKFKQILGIEGVDVALVIPEKLHIDEELLEGKIVLTTQSNQTVNSILIQFIERFSRGNKGEKRIDEYIVGKLFLEGPIQIKAGEKITRDFAIKYKIAKSEMDKFEDQNIIYKGLVRLAKFFNKVKSEYRIEVEVDVKGTALNPIIKEIIKVE